MEHFHCCIFLYLCKLHIAVLIWVFFSLGNLGFFFKISVATLALGLVWGVSYAALTTKIVEMFGGPVIVLSKYVFYNLGIYFKF